MIWFPTIEVRCVGARLYEARTDEGRFSAVGHSRAEAIGTLRERIPPHGKPDVVDIPDPKPTYDDAYEL